MHDHVTAIKPINSCDEDILGRVDFARSLAEAIANWQGKESLVIALYGPWGSGKTSIKNMILEILKRRDPPNNRGPNIIEFNPWGLASQDKILEGFFKDIGVALGRTDKSEKHRKIISKMTAYSAALRASSSLLETIRSTIPLILLSISFFLGLTIVAPMSFYALPWLRIIAFVVVAILSIIAVVLKTSANVCQAIADLYSSRAGTSSSTLAEMKDEISRELEDVASPILVVLDDVDRLSIKETALLFQLVKINADFPNIVYLFCFQRDI